ncbi:peroxidase-like [Pollicipes pollicipes]|uniref:peroxidase-like n=1 Tax=Pollicipes pollicipes TaxID=41117 RepID=UPI001884C32A|nr:peroxidase-like [Pollicipes pollicipes]
MVLDKFDIIATVKKEEEGALLLSALCANGVRAARCNCQPVSRCPQAPAAGADSCRLPGKLRGYCCPRMPDTCPTTSGSMRRKCRPLVLCPEALADPVTTGGQACRLGDGSTGVMCSDADISPKQKAARTPEESKSDRRNAVSPLLGSRVVTQLFIVAKGGDMQEAARKGARGVKNQLLRGGPAAPWDSVVGVFNLNFRSSQDVQTLCLQGLQNQLALQALNDQGGGDMLQLVSRYGGGQAGARAFPAKPTLLPNCTVAEPIVCRSSIYRTANGECNNLQRPREGSALTGFKRLLESTFDDGFASIRSRSVTGRPLPSPRLISERVVETISSELKGFTLSVMQWGQFVDHDFNHALVFNLGTAGSIQCCENDGRKLPATPLHPQCIPISIPADDPFYSQFGQRCMSLVRSLPAPSLDCIARPSTPINEITSHLDASNLYGSEQEEQDGLRTFSDGLLITSNNNLLPLSSTPARQRTTPRPTVGPGTVPLYLQRGKRSARQRRQTPIQEPCVNDASVCFRAGESRVNEQSALTVMHTIFTREHNRVAGALKQNHRDWDDEKLFQEARRIVIAEWQHIIYNEWLPIIVGFDYARDHDLLPLTSGFSAAYDKDVNPTASNEFATAAFRFGHSMLRDMYHLINANGNIVQSVNLTRTFFNPTVVGQRFVEHARTLVATRPETFDANIISSVHEQLFTTNFRFGLDLIALNIQRGRDHAIPTYVTVLKACRGDTVSSWGDFNRLMDSRAIDQLRSLYDDPQDVDLFIGGLAERRAAGAQVGPTFQCLIGQQFFDVRFGDRYFYDNGGFPHSFTAAQLAEIRKSSWARMMCDTLGPEFGNDFTQVQPLAFVESTVGANGVGSCNSQAIPSLNLAVF